MNHTSLVYKATLGSVDIKELSELMCEHVYIYAIINTHIHMNHIVKVFSFSLDLVMNVDQILQVDDATRLWDIRTGLNPLQKCAIEMGTRRRFQLIQGPPGILFHSVWSKYSIYHRLDETDSEYSFGIIYIFMD